MNITFPYAAFDLNITAPMVKNETRYFPLQRAPDDQSATLGRAFLQEAYIITNFETSTFSISQATHDGSPSNIIPIKSNVVNGTSGSNSTGGGGGSKSKKSGGFGTGAIAGVAIAIAIVGIVVAVLLFFFWRRRKNAKRNQEFVHDTTYPTPETKTVLSTTRTSHDDPEPKKYASNISVQPLESPLTPPLGEMQGSHGFDSAGPSSQAPFELAAHRLSRTEMGAHDYSSRPELPSPGLAALRSELSTPEPIMPHQELPTPDPSAELESPPLRPVSPRMDSSDSGGSLKSEGLYGLGLHSRNPSDESGTQRPQSNRRETEDSIESPILGRYPSGGTTTTDIETPVTPVATTTTGRNLGSLAKRPVHLRQDSDTWQTRLESAKAEDQKPAASRFSMMEKDKKDSNASEQVAVSPVSTPGAAADSPVARKPVPVRTASDETTPLVEENEDEERGHGHGGKDGKDEKARQ